jgi:hypothetical protein
MYEGHVPMIISMAWTTNAYLKCRKRCTRRMWTDAYLAQWQKAWDEGRLYHSVYDRSPRNGGRQIGTLRLTCRPYREPLSQMPVSDLEAEGGLWSSLAEFIELFGDTHLVPAVVRFDPFPFEHMANKEPQP